MTDLMPNKRVLYLRGRIYYIASLKERKHMYIYSVMQNHLIRVIFNGCIEYL